MSQYINILISEPFRQQFCHQKQHKVFKLNIQHKHIILLCYNTCLTFCVLPFLPALLAKGLTNEICTY